MFGIVENAAINIEPLFMLFLLITAQLNYSRDFDFKDLYNNTCFRKGYGKWYGVTLSAENKVQFLIPEGFAHGFLVLSDEAEFCYKVNDFYHPNDEGGMAWNDPEIGIEWPELKGEYQGSASAEGYTLADGTALILSDKDQKWMGLKDTFKF